MKKPILSALWALINILLFWGMMAMDRNHAPLLYFKLMRSVFMISMIMQVLVAVGWVKLEKN